MKITLKTVALLLGICLSVNAIAQRGPQGTPQERTERQVSRLKEQLTLNDDQVTKIKAIMLARFVKTDSLRAANGGGNNGGGGMSDTAREGMKAMTDKFNTQLNSVLTKEQADKYKQIQEEQRQNRGNRGN
jgi:periplasmic protein CpxP/Spy